MAEKDVSRLNRNLTIAVVTQQIGRVVSGIGLHAYNLVHHLMADGHKVIVIAPESQRPPGSLPYDFRGVPRPFAEQNQARWIALSWRFEKELARLEREQNLDLVHFTDAREALFYRTQAPRIGNVNDTYAAQVEPLSFYRQHYADGLTRWGYYTFVHFAERFGLPRLSAIIANSKYTARTIMTAYHLPVEKVYTCYKSIDLEHYAPAILTRDQYQQHPARLLFVGGNMQRKGLPTLIQAAPAILKSFPETEFWVVGQDKAVDRMKALCSSLGVMDRFRFLGWQSQADLPTLYAQADLFILPSLTEAFGVVVLEAMAAGVAVIATRVGGIPEIIQDGVNGLLIPPLDPAELSAAAIRLLREADFHQRLVEVGFATVRRFDVAAMMACTYRIYQAVLAG